MKKFLKIMLGIIILFVLFTGGILFYLSRGLDTGKAMIIDSVNLTSLHDGVYYGKYDSGRWSNEVNVTVKGHLITKIDVVKDVKFPMEKIKVQIIKEVIDSQSTKVDIISGATVTSKAYLKAIENALKK